MSSQTKQRGFQGSVSDISAAARWIESVADELDLPQSRLFSMQVCLEELMSNIARHGARRSRSNCYRPQSDLGKDLTISVSIEQLPDRVKMTVEDNGRPFDVVNATAKGVDQSLDETELGGLGILLIKSFSDRLEYRRTPKGNIVVLDFIS